MNSAIISSDRRYRYWLDREGLGEGRTVIIMVNPSTADATTDDHTIRKLIGFGERHRWGKLIIGNLFAYRATDVRELREVDDPVGPENDRYLREMFQMADRVVYAWGPLNKQPRLWRHRRWRAVDTTASLMGKTPLCIGPTAKDGMPCHPLTLSYDLPINEWYWER